MGAPMADGSSALLPLLSTPESTKAHHWASMGNSQKSQSEVQSLLNVYSLRITATQKTINCILISWGLSVQSITPFNFCETGNLMSEVSTHSCSPDLYFYVMFSILIECKSIFSFPLSYSAVTFIKISNHMLCSTIFFSFMLRLAGLTFYNQQELFV